MANSNQTISKILVANRGEIAVRVMRTARNLGYDTVAVYSEADANALHVSSADEAICVGSSVVAESYLKIDNIIEAAKKTGADAIHPGYGFLSENAAFAKACADNDIVFIGPPAGAIELMGSKRQSKIAMEQADVPCIPGYQGDDQSLENLIAKANDVGTPLMIKASAGGGGRGMRLVHDLADIEEQINSARSEAENAFGSGELILERAVLNPRHIEIQVFADKQGNVVYLGERDCSVQRRHQKVVEEAPSPAVSEELRQRMGEAAVNAAKACDYVGAGTVEFLLAPNGEFYFLEMNTRLQVEHPVTELVTGQDLVEWQIDVAQGASLPLSQDDIQLNGHAIEVRLYAEDTTNNYMPQTGTVTSWRIPNIEGLRIDHGIKEGQEVSPFYDPMLAKVITWGKNRQDAVRKLQRALKELVMFGVTTNQYFLVEVLNHKEFVAGDFSTAFLGERFADNPSLAETSLSTEEQAIATLLLHQHSNGVESLNRWHSAANMGRLGKFGLGEKVYDVRLQATNQPDCFSITDENGSITVQLGALDGTSAVILLDGIQHKVPYELNETGVSFIWQGKPVSLINRLHDPQQGADAAGSGQIRAPMDGAVVDILVEANQAVSKGTTLAILEAMKMEHPIKADKDGVVSNILIGVGDQVKTRNLLIEIGEDAG
ncbi:MAG: acetyl/propionyl/methylcrotonyl-CoA carboxylase subunit alpha [Pseudomonadales bacterium]|nr:acetyl/propionyl/methylcrotonyl-CoA carboxylase subunit alpha [Pseudomonadales bacterium]